MAVAGRRVDGVSTERNVALVVGAQGVIGRNLVRQLSADDSWQILGLSRRGGDDSERVRHLEVDLLDPAGTRQALAQLGEVTHVFYTAYQDRPTWAELV